MSLFHHFVAMLARIYHFFYDLLGLGALFDRAFATFLRVVELDLVPDRVLRLGIRLLLRVRLLSMAGTLEQRLARKLAFVQELKCLPVAVQTAAANEQHYEVPTEYFVLVLGRHLKYSCCLFNAPGEPLNDAERNMLSLYCARARLQDGQRVLELGCGWGSLSLFMAQAYPSSRFTAVSNSATQREFILRRARDLDVHNLDVVTADVVDLVDAPLPASAAKNGGSAAAAAGGYYDRVVSIEMFEHMKNYQELLRRVSTWLKPGGLLFVHIFCHRSDPYHFEERDESDWMARHFFSGGTMPSLDLLLYFQQHVQLQQQWYVSGRHYSLTCEAWLQNHDRFRRAVLPIFASTYGRGAALRWFVRWRLFYLACSELFNYNGGEEWGVAHYLFQKPPQPPQPPQQRAAAAAAALPQRAE